MNFNSFDTSKIDNYSKEARKKWGSTDAYREFEEKTADQSPQQMKSTGDALMDIFAEIGSIRHLSPGSEEAQTLIAKLQNFITEHYYTCTKQILRGLGQMYVADERMMENIDKAGGEGTAAFTFQAIQKYT